MDVSVVIPLYNGAATIGEQLGALAAQVLDGSWEVNADMADAYSCGSWRSCPENYTCDVSAGPAGRNKWMLCMPWIITLNGARLYRL